MFYSILLSDGIEEEKDNPDRYYDTHDRLLLEKMTDEINGKLGTDIHYLVELHMLRIEGSGSIIKDYIKSFNSEYIKSDLIYQIMMDKIEGCERLALDLYLNFRKSDLYKTMRGGITAMYYDNIFRKFKPAKYKNEFLRFIMFPIDASWLPFSLRRLTALRLPCLEQRLIDFVTSGDKLIEELVDFQISDDNKRFIKRELCFRGIEGLKYYPSDENIKLIEQSIKSEDRDISMSAKKSLEYISKHY